MVTNNHIINNDDNDNNSDNNNNGNDNLRASLFLYRSILLGSNND